MGDFLIYVQIRTAKAPAMRPSKATEEEATAEMAELRAAKRERRDVDLPWLVVHGDDIVSANLEGQVDPRTADELYAEARRLVVEMRELGFDI